ncbi:MAG: glycosyltransferase family 2 protein [Tyzzerella sp.]|nr:glycosyltransferase family 2 protein [Tyzzerella sp.]
MKFSVIIPVYNVEKYIRKCLDSVLSQTYCNYEVIVVNDGSTDDSQSIIEEYANKDTRICGYMKENGGLSDARNYGLQYVTGEYIVFLDSDDYLETGLLQHLYDVLSAGGHVDLIRYSFQKVDEDGNILQKIISQDYKNLKLDDIVGKILETDYVEPAWSYAYRTVFFVKNGFKYPKGYYHEDYGLTPYIILKAKSVSSSSYIGLNYVQRAGSIMNSGAYEKEVRKAEDVLELYLKLKKRIEDLTVTEKNKQMMLGFMSRVLLEKTMVLEKKDRHVFIEKIKGCNVSRYLYLKGVKGAIRRVWAKISLNSYCNYFYK